MKYYAINILLAIMSTQSTIGFAPSAPKRSLITRLEAALTSQKIVLDTGLSIFDDDNALRSAYDEWRNEYRKGEFQEGRFENFVANFKALTIANLEAREKASAKGQNPPMWMYLNEYGDLSESEYHSSHPETDADIYKIYEDWCERYEVQIDGERYEIFATNYRAMKDYTARTGKVLKLNQFADYTREEAAAGQKALATSRKTLIIPKMPSQTGGEATEPSFDQTRATRVLQNANGVSYTSRTMPVRGTQVIQSALPNGQQSDFQGTRPIQGTRRIFSTDQNGQPKPVQGTRPIQGTRRIMAADSIKQNGNSESQYFQGTRPIQGTQRISSDSNDPRTGPSVYGTRPVQGTRPIASGSYGTRPVRGTQRVFTPEEHQEQTSYGTQPVLGTRVIQSDGANGDATGTKVVQPAGQRTSRGTISLGQAPNTET